MISNIKFWIRNGRHSSGLVGGWATWEENGRTYLTNGMRICEFTPRWQTEFKQVLSPRGENRKLLMANLNEYYHDQEFAKCILYMLRKGIRR